jgi:NAD(P)-dependent dehydrogenase (short-subunit alcohol dehydrogenase family)
MSPLKDRIVLITGAARGIGAASARRLAAGGARLVLADVDGPGVDKLAAELAGVAVTADVTRNADIARMVDEPYRRWGRLDVLFNNAGVIRVQPLHEVTEAEWDRVMNVNLRAAFFVLQAVARRMVQQSPMPGSELRGKLIHTASIAAYRGGNHLMTPYSATKVGVVSLTRSAAQALAKGPHHVELRVPGRRRHCDVGANRPGDRGAAEPAAARAVEAPHCCYPARPAGDRRGRGGRRAVLGRPRLRLHDRPGHQGRRRPRDGGLRT